MALDAWHQGDYAKCLELVTADPECAPNAAVSLRSTVI